MNARTIMPLAMVTALFSVSLIVSAADNLEPTMAGLPDNEAQAKARAALNADEEASDKPGTESPPVEETTPQTAPALAAVSTATGPQPDNEAQAKARAALNADEPGPVAIEPAPVAAVAVEQPTPQPVSEPTQVSRTGDPLTHGMAAPSLPTTASQQAQLQALLQQYRADAISSSDYHTRRAEILAGK